MDSTTDGSSSGDTIDGTIDGGVAADDFARVLASLSAPEGAPATPPISAAMAYRPAESVARIRTPELMGADELAAPPRPFPPPPPHATPLVAPPTPERPIVESMAAVVKQSPSPGDPFRSLLEPTSGSEDLSEALREELRLGSGPAAVEPRDIVGSTLVEKIILVAAIIVPPIGVVAAIVGAIASMHRRGWVVGILKVALPIGIVLSLLLAVVGYFGVKQLRAQQLHDQTATASAAFCSTIAADPSMIALPDFGWPAPAASIPDSISAMQAYADSWSKLAKVSPPGIATEVGAVATSAQQLTDAVKVTRTVNDVSNVATMSSVAASSSVPTWFTEFCE